VTAEDRDAVALSVVVLGKPIPQGRARVPRFGKPYYPPTSKAYRRKLVAALAGFATLTPPVAVSIRVAKPRANADLDNFAKMALDAMQDAGVLASDDVRSVVALSVEVVDGEARMEIEARTRK